MVLSAGAPSRITIIGVMRTLLPVTHESVPIGGYSPQVASSAEYKA